MTQPALLGGAPVPPRPTSFIEFCGQLWEFVKDFWSVLRPMRFCVAVWVAISLLIIFIPQSQDALLALLEDAVDASWSGLADAAAFAILALLWAFQTFYWARFVSRLPRRPRPPAHYPPPWLCDSQVDDLARSVPRWLGGLVLLSVWIALFRANFAVPLHAGGLHGWRYGLVCAAQEAVVTIVMALLFCAYLRFVRHRRAIARAIYRRSNLAVFKIEPEFERDLTQIEVEPRVKTLALGLGVLTLLLFVASGFVELPYPRLISCAVAGIWIILLYWAAVRIHGVPRGTLVMIRLNVIVLGALFVLSLAPSGPLTGFFGFLSSGPIIMSVAVAWVFLGTFLLAFPGEVLRLPLTTMVVLFAVLVSLIGRNDNHVLRASDKAAEPWHSQSIDDAFAGWWTNVGANSPGPVPLVLVATAGGASRAAYWTAEVLGRVEAEHPGFHKQIFAVSSVSGGSIGTMVYRALLNDLAENGAADCQSAKINAQALHDCSLKVIDNDFLAPTFLTGLYADLTQRFLPGALLPDRAGALEHSWEAAWQKVRPKSPGLDRPFHALWTATEPGEWRPALLINGTSEKTGRKIITSNLAIDSTTFPDALDYFCEMHGACGGAGAQTDIPISTAAHNSARFPYIDAAGTLIRQDTGITDRIVDGGYHENFGAASIYDLLRALMRVSEERRTAVKFFVLQISSDPDFRDQARRDAAWQNKSSFGVNIASDATAPPIALFNVGGALGYRATHVLEDLANSPADDAVHYAHFALTDPNESMSWVLSQRSTRCLETEWAKNYQAYSTLAKFMGWTPPAQAAAGTC